MPMAWMLSALCNWLPANSVDCCWMPLASTRVLWVRRSLSTARAISSSAPTVAMTPSQTLKAKITAR